MTEKLQMYRCEVCGNFVQILIAGDGELVCCGEAMKLQTPKTADLGLEKHVPVFVTTEDGGKEVHVGSQPHPMLDEHYIMFIETVSADQDRVSLQFLHPGQQPMMKIEETVDKVIAKEYCNIHGLWEGKND